MAQVVDLTPFEIPRDYYKQSIEHDDHCVVDIKYNVRDAYGVEKGFFQYGNTFFRLREMEFRNEKGMLLNFPRRADFDRLNTLLKFEELNWNSVGVTKEKLAEVPMHFLEKCIDDIFVWFVKNSDFSDNFTLQPLKELKEQYYPTLKDIFAHAYVVDQMFEPDNHYFYIVVCRLYPIINKHFSNYDYFDELCPDVEKIVKKNRAE